MESCKLKMQCHYLIIAFLVLTASSLLQGCDRGDIKIGNIEINAPKEALPGKAVQLTITVKQPISDPAALRFQWNADRGKFNPDGKEIDSALTRQFIAPEQPGPVNITIKIIQGEQYVDAKSFLITVKGAGDQTTVTTPDGQIASAPPGTQTPSVDAPPFIEVNKLFFPSGWMGDGEDGKKHIQVDSIWRENPHSVPTCYKWSYQPGAKGWAAVAWQYPENNYGRKPGRNLTGQGFTKVTFWVRGNKGGEQLTFKAGGHTDPSFNYQASFEAETPMTLTKDWQQGMIKLPTNLSNIAAGFVWVAARDDNPDGIVFYLDDIRYEK